MVIHTFKNWKSLNEQSKYSVNDVIKIQNELIGLGYSLPKYGVDGKYGPETKSVVANLQSDLIKKGYSLPKYGADGYWGNETEVAVNNYKKDNPGKKLATISNIKRHKYPFTSNKDNSYVSSKDSFSKITGMVIAELEGGYYHPDMLKDKRVKDGRFAGSGETMFGMDRRTGTDFANTAAGKEFWSIIDNENARENWRHGYSGGKHAAKLKQLVIDQIKPFYDKFINRYLTNDAKEIVKKSGKLQFHFIYATWNGEGWFKKFATDINDAVNNGITLPKQLERVAIDSRTKEGLKKGQSPNSLIAQGGQKVENIFSRSSNELDSYAVAM